MTNTTLYSIVNNVLLKRRYPIHFWLDFALYGATCIRELSLDHICIINSKIIPINDYNAIDLPADYQDYITVGRQSGQNVIPLVETHSLNRIVNRTADFIPQPYIDLDKPQTVANNGYGYFNGMNWIGVTWNNYGEFVGRIYGLGAGLQDDVFMVVKERNQIQLSDYLQGSCNIVMDYMSDGTKVDAITKIDSYAIATIEAYIIWQMKETTRYYTKIEKQDSENEYLKQIKILIARVSPLNVDVFRRLIQKNTKLSPKNQ